MQNYQFRTNINSALGINVIIPSFEKVPAIKSWMIDTNSPDFLLTIECEDHISSEDIIAIVTKAGFKIEVFSNPI